MTRKRPIRAKALAAVAVAVACGTAVTATQAAGTDAARADGDAAAAGPTSLYAPPANPGAVAQIAELDAQGQDAKAALLRAMVTTPQSVWLTGQEGSSVKHDARQVVTDAEARQTLPVLSLYNVPGRDCAQYSAGGASDTAEYLSWIDDVAKGIGKHPALVVLEPDSLALMPGDCGQDDEEGTLTAARFAEIRYAVDTLTALPHTTVYLDAGHSDWHSVNSLVPRLIEGGIDSTQGFFLNASNYQTDADLLHYGTLISGCLAYATEGGDPADCPNQWSDPADAQQWLADNVTSDQADWPGFVTDTSRNGQGPWTAPDAVYTDPQEWCNPPDRGLGARPTLQTDHPVQDAQLWIKIPGESDGECLRGTQGPEDPERGTVLPPAGGWFPEQALELIRLAQPPFQP